MKARRVVGSDELERPGDFTYTLHEPEGIVGMIIHCPGCGAPSYLAFDRAPHLNPPRAAKWAWDGNEVAPTLSPSVLSSGCCKWHGWLRNGEWVTV